MNELWESQLLKPSTGMVSQIVFIGPLRPSIPALFENKVHWQYCEWGNRNKARNLGQKVASEDYILGLDDDVGAPDPAAVLGGLQILQNFPQVAVVAGSYKSVASDSYWSQAYNLHCNLWLGLRPHRFLAGNILYRKGKFHWPEDLLGGGEEDRIARDLAARGLQIHPHPVMTAHHNSRHTRQSLLARLRQHELGRARDRVGSTSDTEARTFTSASNSVNTANRPVPHSTWGAITRQCRPPHLKNRAQLPIVLSMAIYLEAYKRYLRFGELNKPTPDCR